MPSLLDCLSDCHPKVRSDLMSFLNITSNELAQEIALLRESGLNIQEENDVYQLVPEMPLLNPQTISTALSLILCIIIEPFLQQMNLYQDKLSN